MRNEPMENFFFFFVTLFVLDSFIFFFYQFNLKMLRPQHFYINFTIFYIY